MDILKIRKTQNVEKIYCGYMSDDNLLDVVTFIWWLTRDDGVRAKSVHQSKDENSDVVIKIVIT